MALSQINLSQLLALMDECVRDRVLALARNPGTTHLVYFENNLLDSSHCGESGVVAVGPNNTLKSLAEVEGKWLNDLPSQREYPLFWCKAKESDARAANWCPVCRCRVRDGWCTPGYRGVHIWQWICCDDVIPPILGGNTWRTKTARRN
jgi:hypothetical protein